MRFLYFYRINFYRKSNDSCIYDNFTFVSCYILVCYITHRFSFYGTLIHFSSVSFFGSFYAWIQHKINPKSSLKPHIFNKNSFKPQLLYYHNRHLFATQKKASKKLEKFFQNPLVCRSLNMI